MQIKASLAKNTTFLTAAFTVQKILSFFYFAFVAHSIGNENLGKYNFALVFSGIFVIFMDFGLGPILTREGAKDDAKLESYLRNILGTKIWLTLLSIIGFCLALQAYTGIKEVPADTLLLTYLASGIIILDTFAFTFFSVFRAKQILKYEALSIIIYQCVIVTAGYFVVKNTFPLYFLILAIICGSIFQFTYSFFLVTRKAKFKVTPIFHLGKALSLLKIAAPFALAGIFFKLSGSIDTVMLHYFSGEGQVGWYGVAFKLTMALTVLPGAFATSFFPAISHYLVADKKRVAPIFELSMFYLMLISLPITFGVFVIADKIIFIAYGPAFEASIAALQIIIVSLIFIFLNYPVGNFLNAANRQTRNTVNMGIALLVNVILNIFLIGKYTFIGASIAALIANVVLVFLGLPIVYKITPFRISFLLKKMFKLIVASSIMGGMLYVMEPYFSRNWQLIPLILIGMVIYIVVLVLIHGLTKEEFHTFLRAFLRKKIA